MNFSLLKKTILLILLLLLPFSGSLLFSQEDSAASLKKALTQATEELNRERMERKNARSALEEELEMEVAGRDLSNGLPRRALIDSEQIREALSGTIQEIIRAIRTTLEHTPPELSADLVNNGIVMVGGGALLRNIDRKVEEDIQLPVSIAEDPLTSVARGTGEFLNQLHLYSRVLESDEET